MDIDTIINTTANAILKRIAERVKARRLEKDLTQRAFAKHAGIGYDAYRRFENTGEITLRNLVQCGIILDDVEAFNNLFNMKQYRSLDELIETTGKTRKKRGTKNE